MACSGKTKCYTTLGFGISFIIIGIALIIAWPFLFNYILMTQMTLSPDSKGYDMWKETPIPMYMDVYLFHWKNAAEVEVDWSVKPELEEMGPYVFSEHHLRVNVTWNDNNTISFQQIRTWHFEPELSGGKLEDKITNLNVIAATVAYTVRHKHYLIRRAVDLIMDEKGEKMFITKTAKELLFDGYEDKLLDMLKSLNVSGINVPFKKFGWFAERNGSASYDGIFNMFTGADDMSKLGMLDRWNGYSHVPFYPDHCGDVVGTSGELWPPVPDNETVMMFASDMCSSVTLDHAGSMELHGIEGQRYAGGRRTFDNGRMYPEQACFGVGEPAPNGVRNVSDCRFGAPAFLSFPHFYLADPSFRERVHGLAPNETLHRLYLDVEASTGLPLNVRARAQINILVQDIPGISLYKHAPTTFMPMMWFTQRATLTADLASQVKVLLVLPAVGLYTGGGFTGLGLLLLLITGLITWRQGWKGDEGEKLIVDDLSVTT